MGGWEGTAHIHRMEWRNQFLMPDRTWLALVNQHCALDALSHVSLYLLSLLTTHSLKLEKTEKESTLDTLDAGHLDWLI